MTVLAIFIGIFLLAIVTRPLTVLFHELGHGVAALLLTREKVSVYIGSYGDPQNSRIFHMGRLEVYFKYNPFQWNQGLCIPHDKTYTINRQIIITMAGPLSSLALGALCICISFDADLHGGIKATSIILLGSCMYDFFINIIPRDEPIQLFDGSLAYNDGQQIRQLVKYKTFPSHYDMAADYYRSEDYQHAAEAFHSIIRKGIRNEHVYRLAISSYLRCMDYTTALAIQKDFEKYCKLNSDDYSTSGLIKSQSGLFDLSLADFQKCFESDPDNTYALNNRGYTYNLIEKYEDAINDFDRAIALEPEHPYAYNNRGLAKIKLGRETEGLEDIATSIGLDPNNSYAYRNLGIYHYDKGEFEMAMEYFEKSFTLNKDTHLISDFMTLTREKLSHPEIRRIHETTRKDPTS